MPKSEDRYTKGRLVPVETTSELRLATVSTRPLKLAFIINETTSKEQLLKYLEYNSTVWGGFYNPLLPTDGQTLRDDWWQVLINQDPDKIIICGEVSEGLLKELFERVQPYGIYEWSDDAGSLHRSGVDNFGSVPMIYPLIHLYEESRPIKKSNLRVPHATSSDTTYYEYAAAQFGTAPDSYREFYHDVFHAESVDFSNIGFTDYLALLSELDERLTPLRATRSGLSPVVTMSLRRLTIVLVGDQFVSDYCLFWNLRMQQSLPKSGTLLLPCSVLADRSNVIALAEFCNKTVVGSNFMFLASASLSKQRLLTIRKHLKFHLDQRIQFVDLWFSDFITNPIRVYETKDIKEISYKDREFRLKVPYPRFAEHLRGGEWVVDMELEDEGRLSEGFLPPKYYGLTPLLSGNPEELFVGGYGYFVRFANEQVSYRVNYRRKFVTGKIPTDREVFDSLLRSKGYEVKTTDKNRYFQGIASLARGLDELKILRERGVRDLFYEMKVGKSYTPKEMMTWLKPGSTSREKDQAHSMISELALKKLFLRGYKIHCPACDLSRWYAVTDIGETMSCAGCLSQFQTPVEAPFRYRLNELVSRGVGQGAISVMLTVLFLRKLSRASFMYEPGLEIQKSGRKLDLDIVAGCDGHLVVAECKELREGASPQTLKEVNDQLSDVVDTASEIGADIVFLSVLAPVVPGEIQKRATALNKRVGKKIAVHLLSGTDLEQGYKSKPLDPSLGSQDSTKQDSSTLYDLLPKRWRRRKGIIEEKGERFSSF